MRLRIDPTVGAGLRELDADQDFTIPIGIANAG
jgi:hypothetical protein